MTTQWLYIGNKGCTVDVYAKIGITTSITDRIGNFNSSSAADWSAWYWKVKNAEQLEARLKNMLKPCLVTSPRLEVDLEKEIIHSIYFWQYLPEMAHRAFRQDIKSFHRPISVPWLLEIACALRVLCWHSDDERETLSRMVKAAYALADAGCIDLAAFMETLSAPRKRRRIYLSQAELLRQAAIEAKALPEPIIQQ